MNEWPEFLTKQKADRFGNPLLPSTEAGAANVAKMTTAMEATAETRPVVGMTGRRVVDLPRRRRGNGPVLPHGTHDGSVVFVRLRYIGSRSFGDWTQPSVKRR